MCSSYSSDAYCGVHALKFGREFPKNWWPGLKAEMGGLSVLKGVLRSSRNTKVNSFR